ncbi:phosphoethanolamine [Pseudovirgaria hyperparasitica]|uniref:ethanolamine-phosphate cytidylyltransferase n=1 Tax=Pseudovirgaria hyperparasitica TaxID=470096 RepID=A0A6A6WC11_9PEZI|nr:phosphoethanolamine [Pseudovirgaria hyperparasitica]KAF2759709.1 phosphoethanolamine [Pseudovirgaria hyperparasitica]
MTSARPGAGRTRTNSISQKESVPKAGQWPVDPQEAVPIDDDRIWIDGCFDFAHHGHAGAMLQARQLGKELLVGVHSDESILENKGPTVMDLKERVAAVDACRWATKSIPHAPYVTSLPWISHYGCQFVVHGDDITSDSSGEDCYRFVKAAGRFKVVKRTPGISTTDLVGRMLLCTKTHFIKSFQRTLAGEEGDGSDEERKVKAAAMLQRIKDYATDESGLNPGLEVWDWIASRPAKERRVSRVDTSTSQDSTSPTMHKTERVREEKGIFKHLVQGKRPKPGQRVVYVDGGFDLFSTGHTEFLALVIRTESEEALAQGWTADEQRDKRVQESGCDYAPVYLIAGIHDDEVINYWKGVNFPIMNMFERGLCVLQCKHVDAVVFGAPFTPSKAFLRSLPYGVPDTVAHGPTSFMPLTFDPYKTSKELGIFKEIGSHEFQNVNAGQIVERIMKGRALYEERQRKKGEKGFGEEAMRRREQMEEDAARQRKFREIERMYSV